MSRRLNLLPAITVLAALAAASAASAAASTSTFLVAADAYVVAASPSANFGRERDIELEGSREKRGYVRFEVTGLAGRSVQRATLRFWARQASSTGFTAAATATAAWDEGTITWNTAPAISSSVAGASGGHGKNRWLTADVTPLVTGNGTVSVGLRTTSVDRLAARERGSSTAAQLVVEHVPASPPVSESPPAISGRALTGETLTASPGTWSSDTTPTYAYRWQRCDDAGGACADIAGETSSTHRVVDGDAGRTLRVVVTATTAGGAASATSAVTDRARDPLVMAAGDISCSAESGGAACRAMETSDILVSDTSDAVLPLGDTQYECGELADFEAFYDPSWGRVKAKSRPAVGNHEYTTSLDPDNHCYGLPSGAPGYFSYFGSSLASPLDPGCLASCRGYYSWDLGSWHVVALNSVCGRTSPSCALGSAQLEWLAADLAANTKRCTLAYFHHPRYSSGQIGNSTAIADMFGVLYRHGVDVVLTGHDHDYERFAPMDDAGRVDLARGVRQFVVGTGGRNVTSFYRPQPGSEVRDARSFGVLRLGLGDGRFSWRFRGVPGAPLSDSGSQPCHSSAAEDTAAPTAPGTFRASAGEAPYVDMSWDAASDDVGVIGYRIERDGVPLAEVGAVTGFRDGAVAAGEVHDYAVRAVDASGNASGPSAAVRVSVPATVRPLLLGDGFETGGFNAWSTSQGLVAQRTHVARGLWAARGTVAGAPAYAYRWLDAAQRRVAMRVGFRVISRSTSLELLSFRNAAKRTFLSAMLSSTGRLALRNSVTGTTLTSALSPSTGEWHELQVVAALGPDGGTTTLLDGVVVPELSLAQDLGTADITRVQLGDASASRTYDVVYDDAAVATAQLP